ncbi:MAG: ABC transporter ATP-binding protein/permease [Treponema sp.]|jgi:ABC-type bacteriocin/lantibiotic exporter with double-glycine peptidase domain|nr:ABC transporter ATP-binding protein/permease [Treponema sp.]
MNRLVQFISKADAVKNSSLQKHIRALWGLVAAQVGVWIISTTAIALIPTYNKRLIDTVLPRGGTGLPGLILMYSATYSVFLIAAWLSERLLWSCGVQFENVLKKSCFDKLLNLSYKTFSEKKSGEYLSMLTKNITTLEADYLTPICALIKDFLAILIYVVIIAYTTSPVICAALFVCSIFAALSPGIYKNRLKKAYKDYIDESALYTKRITDMLDGFDMIDARSRVSFTKANARFTDILSLKRLRYGYNKVNSATISGTISILLIDISIFALCGYLILNGHISAGIVVAALTYTQSFMDPFNDMLYCINTLNSTKDIAHELDMFLSAENHTLIQVKPVSKISCQNVIVDFGSKKLCYNMAISIGKKYVLYGQSGTGKSTLFRVLTGHTAYSGAIFVDDSASGTTQILNSDICYYLSQHQHIFSEDFLTNVSLFGAYPYNEAELRKTFDIERLFGGIKGTLDCGSLSGGEKQALKICRMLVQGKDILLLDEPFSSLDKENTSKILANLSECSATILLITHDHSFKELGGWEHVNISEVCREV